MTDEKYVFIKDSAEKKRVARGYHKMNRTGKGRVRFPDDNLTRKEKASLSKDLGTYKMGEPVYWKEFRTWPAEFQKEYFEKLDEKFNVGSGFIAEMMGCGSATICRLKNKLGINREKAIQPSKKQIEEFRNWIRTFRGVDISETPYETRKVVEQQKDEYPINTADRPYKSIRPSQIEKFEKRYSGSKGDDNEPRKPSGKRAIAMVEQNIKFIALDPGENTESIVNQFRAFITHFTGCEMIEITIKTVETRKD